MAAISAQIFETARVSGQAIRREVVEARAGPRLRILFWLGVCLRVLLAPMPLRTGESEPGAEIEQAFTCSLRGID